MNTEGKSVPAIGSLAGYAMSESDDDLDDMHKISGNISGSDDEHSAHSAPSRTYSPVIKDSEILEKKKPQASSLALVDYGEHEEDDSDQDDMQISDGDDGERNSPTLTDAAQNGGVVDYDKTLTGEELSAANETASGVVPGADSDDVLIPPSPPGSPPHSLIEKITRISRRAQGSIDNTIQTTKEFRNPSIYEKLLSHMGVNDKGTNYPPELFDPSIWDKSSYYDELAKLQFIEMEKRKADKKDKVKVDFITATKSTASSDSSESAGAKKTKWDTAGQKGTLTSGSAAPPVGSLIKK